MKILFHDGWTCKRKGSREESFSVRLPHDSMLLDARCAGSCGGVNIGWYDAQDYSYTKTFRLSEAWKGQKLFLEFEGVYRKASVFVNGTRAARHEYGYTGFYVEISDYVRPEQENVVRVDVENHDQPNSRWYSGTGIYRPVWLHILPQTHICPDGIRITTLDYRSRRIRVDVNLTGPGTVSTEISDGAEILKAETGESRGRRYSCEMRLPQAKLWSPQSPYLYRCRVAFGGDVREIRFGIRQIQWSFTHGFCINGKRTLLYGACIHHDNGLLGACAYDFAERRKVRILKENGYNAVRSAHNPCSRALLEACDELGMLVLDEYVDVWYIHKTKYDYADSVEKNYRSDLSAMVAKDYNHPSVVLYSTGNEVSETAQKRGILLCKEMTQYLHSIDGTRPVTCGINIFFNFLSSIGLGVYSEKKASHAAGAGTKRNAVGSAFFNSLAGMMGAGFMKFAATWYPCDVKTRDAFANMDIAGYNYGINRYCHDLKKYPSRLILGSETFCADAYRFVRLAKQNKRIVGDFVWAGMDYLGEVGIGAWEYADYAPRFDSGPGWVSAGSGRIDLTGKPLAEMTYTKVAFGRQDIGVAVVPADRALKRHSPSAWKLTNAVESWSWNGCEGRKTKVEVYSRAYKAAVYVNGVCVGIRRLKDTCRAVFWVKYMPGELRAAAFDKHGRQTAERVLRTAGAETKLTLCPEQEHVGRDELLYLRMKYTDREGELKPLMRGKIKVKVDGGEVLGIGSACPYYTGSYLGDTCDTYYGEAMVIIRPGKSRYIRVRAAGKFGKAAYRIKVTDESAGST